jgi:hypothetical protein
LHVDFGRWFAAGQYRRCVPAVHVFNDVHEFPPRLGFFQPCEDGLMRDGAERVREIDELSFLGSGSIEESPERVVVLEDSIMGEESLLCRSKYGVLVDPI